jgi:hypothetical protein
MHSSWQLTPVPPAILRFVDQTQKCCARSTSRTVGAVCTAGLLAVMSEERKGAPILGKLKAPVGGMDRSSDPSSLPLEG